MAWCRRRAQLAAWEDTECFSYYDMLTPHEVYEVVGSQLTEADVDILSFLLDEIYPPTQHPLDPQNWTEMGVGESGDLEVRSPPHPRLVRAWNRLHPCAPTPLTPAAAPPSPPRTPCSPPTPDAARSRPKCGVQLLLELERRGHLSEANMEPLLRLLRVLTRHDLTPFVTRKRRRTVSPEREYPPPPSHVVAEEEEDYPEDTRSCHHDNAPLEPSPTRDPAPTRCTEGGVPVGTAGPVRRRRAKGRHGNSRRRRRAPRRAPEPQEPPVTMDTQGPLDTMATQEGPPPSGSEAPGKATCSVLCNLSGNRSALSPWPPRPPHVADIRLRVRPEYCEQESVLRATVSSDKRDPLARGLELFNRANAALRGRDLGAVHCDIRFSELSKLDAFWSDYLSGALTAALRDVFLTEELIRQAGQQELTLLVSVDQDDYEHGRRILLQNTHYSF